MKDEKEINEAQNNVPDEALDDVTGGFNPFSGGHTCSVCQRKGAKVINGRFYCPICAQKYYHSELDAPITTKPDAPIATKLV